MGKIKSVTILLLPAHKMALQRLAEIEGECVSVVLRRLIMAEAERKGVWQSPLRKITKENHPTAG